MSDPPPDTRPSPDPEAIVAALEALRRRPAPPDPSPYGCWTAIVSVAVLAVLPTLVLVTPLTAGAGRWAGAVLVLAALVGGLVGLLGGGFVRGRWATEVDEAVEALVRAWPDGDPAAMREAAVRIVEGAFVAYGPTMTSGFDPDETGRRLGGALAYVREVERVLVERDLVYRCFTGTPPSGSPSRTSAG